MIIKPMDKVLETLAERDKIFCSDNTITEEKTEMLRATLKELKPWLDEEREGLFSRRYLLYVYLKTGGNPAMSSLIVGKEIFTDDELKDAILAV